MEYSNKPMLRLEDIEDWLGVQIGYESFKGLDLPWTEEYREGYVDGLKRALEGVRELAPQGYFPAYYVDRDALMAMGFNGDQVDDETMSDIARRMSAYITEEEYWCELTELCEEYQIPQLRH